MEFHCGETNEGQENLCLSTLAQYSNWILQLDSMATINQNSIKHTQEKSTSMDAQR